MLTPNANLGAYRLIERIGAGGMGEVWKAEDTRLGRVVAIKILPPAIASDPEALARLRREARTAAQLNHPNIATIHSIEEADGRLFISMEFVDGEPLTKLIKRGVSEADLCRIGRSVADALAEAHAKGIVHRDIKPDNVIVSGARVKVLDFGIAKQIGMPASGDEKTATFVTQQGMIVGTIHYMSPEQALGKPLDPRTDIFSLGVVLYEGATGRLPFQGETITETMTQIIRDEPQEPARVNPKISPGLNAIIQRCMRKNRDERYPTAGAVGHALEEQLGRASTARYTAAAPTVVTAPHKPQRSGAWLWITVAVMLAIVAAVLAIQHRRGLSVAQAIPPASAGKAVAGATQTAAPPPTQTTVSVTAPQPKIEEQQPAPPPAPAPVVEAQPKPIPTQTVAEQKPESKSPDALFQEGMAQLRGGDWQEARKTFHRVLELDPHYAKAHYRIGEIALFNRNFPPAIEQLQLALNDESQLNPHEQALARLGIAIASRDRQQAQQLAREMSARWPGDPELARLRREFGGMTGEGQRPFGRRQRQ